MDLASSLAAADLLLDTQIGTNEADIAQEISDRTDADADIQAELDDTQTGAGLGTDGTYATNSGTNYIDAATSLANADILLDTQIAASAGDISDIQAEVDQVETGAGLDTDGAYAANSGSNYLDLASSLAAADLSRHADRNQRGRHSPGDFGQDRRRRRHTGRTRRHPNGSRTRYRRYLRYEQRN